MGQRGGERFLLLCHSRVGGNPVFAKFMPEGIRFGTNIRISDKPLCEVKLDHVYVLQGMPSQRKPFAVRVRSFSDHWLLLIGGDNHVQPY